MAGILCAHFLRQAGVDCVLAEADRLCAGATGNTTAKITSQHGLVYDGLLRRFGAEKAGMYLHANEAALARYRGMCREIDCGFEEKDAFVYSLDDRGKLEKELAALEKLGFHAGFTDKLPLPFPVAGAVRFERQAQFDPLRFAAAAARGLRAYEHTPVRRLEGTSAVTDRGTIRAEKVIVATHFPFLNRHGSYFLKMYQHRSYVLALENAANVGGMYVDEAAEGLSFRNAQGMLLLGGGISGEGKALTDPMNEYVKAHCFGGDKSFVTRVDTATLGNKAGIIGAAALCLSAPAAMPLKLAPAFKDYLWGGERLKSEYGKHTRLSPLAESWELSCHKDGPSTIVNGPDAGRTLAEYAARHPACVGTRHTDGVFPVLIKLIDAARPLSVQVHPDDAYAQRVEGEPGKTEMWYVVDAQPGAQLYYGFQRELTREEAARRIADGTLTDVLNAVPVKAGDVFFIDAGTVHAIGAGILIAEIQQNSNTTYRVFDYGRLGADGKPRALHVEKALDVARLCPPERPAGPMGKPEQNGDCTSTLLAKCGYFTARLLDVAGSAPLCADGESFHSLLCLSGSGAVVCGGGAVPFAKGDSLFLPAGLGAYTIAGRTQLVLTTL